MYRYYYRYSDHISRPRRNNVYPSHLVSSSLLSSTPMRSYRCFVILTRSVCSTLPYAMLVVPGRLRSVLAQVGDGYRGWRQNSDRGTGTPSSVMRVTSSIRSYELLDRYLLIRYRCCLLLLLTRWTLQHGPLGGGRYVFVCSRTATSLPRIDRPSRTGSPMIKLCKVSLISRVELET